VINRDPRPAVRRWAAHARCRVRGSHRLGVVARSGDPAALVACAACGWSAQVPMVSAGRPRLDVAAIEAAYGVVLVDAHAAEVWQAAVEVDAATRHVDLTTGGAP